MLPVVAFSQAVKMTGKRAWLRIVAKGQCRLGVMFVGEASLSMDMDLVEPLFLWGTQVLLSRFKQVLGAQFGYPTSDVMVQDSSGHRDAEIPWTVFSVAFFCLNNCFHHLKIIKILKK